MTRSIKLLQLNKEKKMDLKENEGRLFKAKEGMAIRLEGEINFEGKKLRVFGIKRKNLRGEEVTDIVVSIGTLKKNQDKRSDASPDEKGVVTVVNEVKPMSISGWKNIAQNKNPYIGIKVKEYNLDNNEYKQIDSGQTTSDDEIDI
jgi:hypothetical protein